MNINTTDIDHFFTVWQKLEDPQWSWLHSVITEWKEDLDRRIRIYKETELCTQFQRDAILAYILQQKN